MFRHRSPTAPPTPTRPPPDTYEVRNTPYSVEDSHRLAPDAKRPREPDDRALEEERAAVLAAKLRKVFMPTQTSAAAAQTYGVHEDTYRMASDPPPAAPKDNLTIPERARLGKSTEYNYDEEKGKSDALKQMHERARRAEADQIKLRSETLARSLSVVTRGLDAFAQGLEFYAKDIRLKAQKDVANIKNDYDAAQIAELERTQNAINAASYAAAVATAATAAAAGARAGATAGGAAGSLAGPEGTAVGAVGGAVVGGVGAGYVAWEATRAAARAVNASIDVIKEDIKAFAAVRGALLQQSGKLAAYNPQLAQLGAQRDVNKIRMDQFESRALGSQYSALQKADSNIEFQQNMLSYMAKIDTLAEAQKAADKRQAANEVLIKAQLDALDNSNDKSKEELAAAIREFTKAFKNQDSREFLDRLKRETPPVDWAHAARATPEDAAAKALRDSRLSIPVFRREG